MSIMAQALHKAGLATKKQVRAAERELAQKERDRIENNKTSHKLAKAMRKVKETEEFMLAPGLMTEDQLQQVRENAADIAIDLASQGIMLELPGRLLDGEKEGADKGGTATGTE